MESGYTIFIPTQGSQYLPACIDSVLNQSFTDFELYILKSHGEDDVTSWIRSLNDERVNLMVHNDCLDIEDNWCRILDVKKRRFMTILGHDDLLDESFG